MNVRPLIVTLRLDSASKEWLDALRQAHFPPERDFLSAHLTMFHAIPSATEGQVRADLAAVAHRPPFTLHFTGLRALGRGVAYVVTSVELTELHATLAHCWSAHLTPQDRQPFAPHVTVQNKVDPVVARQLLDELRREFIPRSGSATGLDLWRYAGGPWEPAGGAVFGNSP